MKKGPLTLSEIYNKSCPLLMLKIGDWKQYGRDGELCGMVYLRANDIRIIRLLERKGVAVGLYPEKGERKISFHNTPISVIYDILATVRSVRLAEVIGGVHIHGVQIRSVGK